jgi:hypothetical protein
MNKTKMISYEHKFTDAEREAMKTELVKMMNDKSGVQGEKKAIMAAYKAQLDDIEKSIQNVIMCINTGSETRHVNCERRVNLDRNLVEYVDTSTGEIRREELPTSEDRQLELDPADPDELAADLESSIHDVDSAEPLHGEYCVTREFTTVGDLDIPANTMLMIHKKEQPGKNRMATVSTIDNDSEIEIPPKFVQPFVIEMKLVKILEPWQAEKMFVDRQSKTASDK